MAPARWSRCTSTEARSLLAPMTRTLLPEKVFGRVIGMAISPQTLPIFVVVYQFA